MKKHISNKTSKISIFKLPPVLCHLPSAFFKLPSAVCQLLFCLSVFLTSSSAQQWKDHYRFTPAQTLNKLKFLDAQTGFTAGSLYNGSYENIHITKDGGKSWKHVNSGYTAMRFMDIFIQDVNTIFMSGNDGIIIRSTDGGDSWQTMNTGTTQQLWGIHFIHPDTGFAVGSYGIILRSTNGGSDWEVLPTGISNLFYDVFFTDKGVGFAAGSNVLLKTTDHGESWWPVSGFPFEAPADWIRSIEMVTDELGYACADIGRIYKTTDGGDNWMRLNSGTQEALFDVDFVDENHGMICGFNGTILKTEDGGDNWIQMQNPIGQEIFYSVDMISKDLGYICTHTGHILKLDTRTNVDLAMNDLPLDYVYPNPCDDFVKINLQSIAQTEVEKIELCTLLGQCAELSVQCLNQSEMHLDISGHSGGLSLLKIYGKSKTISLSLTHQTR